jgi:GNAT superfamily N-acetyltransferase
MVRVHHGFDAERFMSPATDVEGGYAWFLGTELENPDVVVLVAERGAEVLGYAYAGMEPQSWKELREEAGFVHDVVVARAARGQGIASRLVEAAAAWLESGAPRGSCSGPPRRTRPRAASSSASAFAAR